MKVPLVQRNILTEKCAEANTSLRHLIYLMQKEEVVIRLVLVSGMYSYKNSFLLSPKVTPDVGADLSAIVLVLATSKTGIFLLPYALFSTGAIYIM